MPRRRREDSEAAGWRWSRNRGFGRRTDARPCAFGRCAQILLTCSENSAPSENQSVCSIVAARQSILAAAERGRATVILYARFPIGWWRWPVGSRRHNPPIQIGNVDDAAVPPSRRRPSERKTRGIAPSDTVPIATFSRGGGICSPSWSMSSRTPCSKASYLPHDASPARRLQLKAPGDVAPQADAKTRALPGFGRGRPC